MDWSTERVETLTRLWTEGYSARQIAEKLPVGFTRNAVIGKAHRLNLSRGIERLVIEPPPPPEPEYIQPVPDAAEFQTWMCGWPTNDAGRFGLFICGRTVQPGHQHPHKRPYCAEHLTMSYIQKKRSTE